MNKPKSIVKITLQAKELRIEDPNSKFKTCCKLYTQTDTSGKWEEAGNTELVESNANPEYKKDFKIQVTERKSKKIKIILYDFVENCLEKIGRVTFTLSDLLVNESTTFSIKNHGQDFGKLIVHSEIHHLSEHLYLKIRGQNLVNKDPFNFRSPYFKLFRLRKGQQNFQIYKSEVIEETLNPLWSQVSFHLYDVCGDNIHTPLKLEVWDSDPLLEDVLMGEGYTSVDQLIGKKSIILRKNKKFKGKIEVVRAEILDQKIRHSF